MGPELDVKPRSDSSMKASVHKENTSLHMDSREELLPCVSNYEDENFDIEASLAVKQTTPPDITENEELNITDVAYSLDVGVVQTDFIDEIESSSSFGDTVSGTENGDEAQSRLHGDHASVSMYDEYFGGLRMRNKKLTAHWRRFIRPLMWRCKWMELQIKELHSQASKYDRELAEYNERKQFEFAKVTLEDLDAKSLPFSSQIGRNKVMKRKKRKRVEESVDLVSYMSQHNLFSYYENKRSVRDDIASMEDDSCKLGKTTNCNDEPGANDCFSLEFQRDNAYEALFRNIDAMQSRVRKLISRVEKVVSNRFNHVVPHNALAGTAQNPAPPESGNGLQVDTSLDPNMGNLLRLESAVSSHGDVTPHNEMIGSTDQLQTEDEVLIENKQAKKELHDFEKLGDELVDKPQVSVEKQQEIPSLPAREADSDSKTIVRSSMKTRYGGKRRPPLRR